MGRVTEVLAYDIFARPLTVKNSDGVVTETLYHPRGWVAATTVKGITPTEDRTTLYEYEPTGLVKKVTQPDGAFTSYEYDAAHRLAAIADNAGNRIEYLLDNAGNRIKEDTKDAGGQLKRTLSRIYNQLGQLATQADAQANPTDFTYDANGNMGSVTDALGRVTGNHYDPLNRLIRTLQDVGGIAAETQFQYDALDNLTKVTDPKGLDTTYTYNGLGDLVQLQSPDTGTTTYTHDSAGNRTSQTDARGVTTTYQYDALNRLTHVGYPTPGLDVAYTYDVTQAVCESGETFSIGRLTRMQDGSGSTQYCHDRFGNLVRKVQTTNGVSFVLRYAYTKAGQLQAMLYPDGTVVDYVRNTLAQVSEVGVALPGQPRATLLHQAAYHPFGPVAGWAYGNGRPMQRDVDQDYRPISVQGGTDGLALAFGFDPVGNLAELTSGSPPPVNYGYDALGRLTETRDGPTQAIIDSYSYDKTGNRTAHGTSSGTSAYGYSSNNHRLTDVGGVIRSYDAAGNTLAIGGSREFVYNDAGRMSQVKQAGLVTREYAYNGRGEQVRRYLGAANTYTLYDEAGHWLGDYDSSGSPIQQAIWMDDLPVGLLANGNQLHYVQPDHLGTPRMVVDPMRDVAVWKWDIKGEAFGNTPPEQDPDGDGIPFVFDMRFPGQRYDSASAISYNYLRDYDLATGRYSQSDPIGLLGGVSTYSYVAGDPFLSHDEKGLVPSAAAINSIILGALSRCLAGAVTSTTTNIAKQTFDCCKDACGSWDVRTCDWRTCLRNSMNCEAKNAAVAGCLVGIFRPELSFVAGWFAKKYVGLLWPCD
ncbi:RHS repeat-associated core domain-containing protein [Pseudoxanthomonas putridarboris]|uniref:RHS repeat-associated core domain-containing protein n=1 Tax=Pseudoxanthomonas putridarboris TaxID=752605 RepID=A0ABU9IXF8_9GAMM